MTAPITTPLLTVSAYNAAVNQAETTRLLDQIIHASALLQGACNRRFDEYIADNYYDARLVVNGGDLLDSWRLMLGADLRSVTTLEVAIPFGSNIGTGTVVSDTKVIIGNDDAGGAPANCGRTLALDSYAGSTNFLTDVQPRRSIGVRGLWGFGGQWVNTGVTVSGLSVSTSATAATVSSATGIEAGQVWRIDSEYLYVNTLVTTAATVDRAYNGSTAAVHANGTAIYYWQAHPLIQKLVRRLVQWDEKQKEFPMSQNVSVGDFSLPAPTDGLPKDVYDTLNLVGLIAYPERMARA